jgi:cadmium resistance protein CadD (predicted permease)
MFAVTNVDDLVVLAVFFGRAHDRGGAFRVVAGQYLGFSAILVAAVLGALGVGLLPEDALPYLGLLPLLLGLRAAWSTWRERHDDEGADSDDVTALMQTGPRLLTVAGITFANGGDNIGVYVPVLATSGTAALVTYVTVFLALVAVWCVAGYWFAARPLIARALARWGHVLLPVVLIGIGLVILVEGGAFGR